MKFKMALLLAVAANISFAASTAPVPVSEYVENKTPLIMSQDELSLDEVQQDVSELKAMNADEADMENVRINWTPAMSAGKIVIKVHKSSTPKVPEFLEVFRQNSANANDLTPINLFDGGKSNRGLVSTAAPVKMCRHNTAICITPSGTFKLDVLEAMHLSRAYGNSPMPSSMFFLANVGIAIHGIPKSEFKDLGRKASHGCVRFHPVNAKLLFDYLQKEGGAKSGAVVIIQ